MAKPNHKPPQDQELARLIPRLEAKLAQDEGDILSYYELAAVHHLRGDRARMLKTLKRLLAREPDLSLAHWLLGWASGEEGRSSQAAAAFQRAVNSIRRGLDQEENETPPPGRPDAASRRDIGTYKEMYTNDPNYAEVKYYQKVVEADQQNFEQAFLLGLAYKRLGWYYAALEAFKQVLKINPDYDEALFELGNTYKHLNRLAEAVKAYSRAVTLNPGVAAPRFQLGLAYLKLGDQPSARREQQALKKLDPDLASQLREAIEA